MAVSLEYLANRIKQNGKNSTENLVELDSYVFEGRQVYVQLLDGHTLLSLAALYNQTNLIRDLIYKGFGLKKKQEWEMLIEVSPDLLLDPLTYALENNNLEIAKELLKIASPAFFVSQAQGYIATIRKKSNEGKLNPASANELIAFVEELNPATAKKIVGKITIDDVINAIRDNNVKYVDLLRRYEEQGGDLNAVSKDGYTPLSFATLTLVNGTVIEPVKQINQTQIFSYLLNHHKVKIDKKDNSGASALDYALRFKNTEVIGAIRDQQQRLFAIQVASMNVSSSSGSKRLALDDVLDAINCYHPDVLSLLNQYEKEGGDLNLQSPQKGYTLLTSCTMALMKKDLSPNQFESSKHIFMSLLSNPKIEIHKKNMFSENALNILELKKKNKDSSLHDKAESLIGLVMHEYRKREPVPAIDSQSTPAIANPSLKKLSLDDVLDAINCYHPDVLSLLNQYEKEGGDLNLQSPQKGYTLLTSCTMALMKTGLPLEKFESGKRVFMSLLSNPKIEIHKKNMFSENALNILELKKKNKDSSLHDKAESLIGLVMHEYRKREQALAIDSLTIHLSESSSSKKGRMSISVKTAIDQKATNFNFILTKFLKEGGSIEDRDETGMNILTKIINYGDSHLMLLNTVLPLLGEKGIDIKDGLGNLPLDMALQYASAPLTIETLIAYSECSKKPVQIPFVKPIVYEQKTPKVTIQDIEQAIAVANVAKVRTLLDTYIENGGDLNAFGTNGFTLLTRSATEAAGEHGSRREILVDILSRLSSEDVMKKDGNSKTAMEHVNNVRGNKGDIPALLVRKFQGTPKPKS